MEFVELASNKIFWTAIISWTIAQTLKVIIHLWLEKEINFERFHGSGGMPSSHTAIIISCASGIGFEYGFDSPLFALGIVMSFIVMYDASGVRRSVGKQAKLLNEIVKDIYDKGGEPQVLKELIGHKPTEVFVGAILGIVVAYFMLGR